MLQRSTYRILCIFALGLVPAAIALAQFPNSPRVPDSPDSKTWQQARLLTRHESKLFVVTVDQPRRRQSCRVQAFTEDKLVCSRAFGGPRTYPVQQIVALIVPGDGREVLRVWLGLNGGLGAAIWGTVVLAAACPACAVATGVAALLLFGVAGAVAFGDNEPDDRLLYLAPGQRLDRKLGNIYSY
jgi:hypothetical protein